MPASRARSDTRRPTARALLDGFQGMIVGFRRWLLPQPSRSGVTPTQFWVHHQLEDTGTVARGALAGRLEVTMPTVTAVIDSLEKEGLVHRGRTPEDRRVVRLELSNRGQKALAAVWARLEEEIGQEIQGIDPAEIRAAARVLAFLGTRLGNQSLDRKAT